MSEISVTGETNALQALQGQDKRPSKPKRVIFMAIKGFLLLLFALAVGTSAQISYQYLRYQKFFVNGESMYPTLNANTVEKDADGNIVSGVKTYNRRDFSTPSHSYLCDFGIMDTRDEALMNLGRFDIVVTYFDSDMQADGTPRDDAALKIKRVLGLPGEEIYFDANGDFYVNSLLCEQAFLEPKEWWSEEMKTWAETAKAETLEGASYASGASNALTLGDDEYFLVGDNRLKGASRDSREIGPISRASIVGKAVAITASCWYSVSSDGVGNESLDWTTLKMPWGLKWL